MGILQRQVRVFLAAFLVTALLLAAVTMSLAAALPCVGDNHQGIAATASTPVGVHHADAAEAEVLEHASPLCCSTAPTTCCSTMAVVPGDVMGCRSPAAPSGWLSTTPDVLRGLLDQVDRRPPRLA